MITKLFSSRFNSKGYNFKENKWIFGCYDELYSHQNIKNSSIIVNDHLWEDFSKLFSIFLKHQIQLYEDSFDDKVIGFALIGNIQVWNGSFIGAKLITSDFPFDIDCSYLNIFLVNNLLQIECHSDNGVNSIFMFVITQNTINELNLNNNTVNKNLYNLNSEDFEYMYYNYTPIKLSLDMVNNFMLSKL